MTQELNFTCFAHKSEFFLIHQFLDDFAIFCIDNWFVNSGFMLSVIWAEESIEHTFITSKCTPKPAQGFVEKCSPIWERISCLDPNFDLPFGRYSPKLHLRP